MNTSANMEGRALRENPSSQRRIPELDGLRGMAILMVIAWHYFYFFPGSDHNPGGVFRSLYVHLEHGIAIGWSGVDLFFVLSGFLIGGILLDARTSAHYFKVFYMRRVFRILPIYYAWILAYLVWMYMIVPSLHSGIPGAAETRWYQVCAHFLFLQNLGFVRYVGLGVPWLVSTWSLAVEEQFYLVAPPVIRFLSERMLAVFLGLTIIGAPLLRLLVRSQPHLDVGTNLDLAYILMPCRADALAIGVVAAVLWRKDAFRAWLSAHGRLLHGLLGLSFAGVIALQAFSPDQHSIAMQAFGYDWLAVFYALILISVLARPGGTIAWFARRRGLGELGRVSYCLYLIHQLANGLSHRLLQLVIGSNPVWEVLAAPLLAFALSYAVATLSWKYFENPLLRLGHRSRYFPETAGGGGAADGRNAESAAPQFAV